MTFHVTAGARGPLPARSTDWDGLLALAVEKGQADVPEVSWCRPGERAALRSLKEDGSFLTKRRMNKYDELRNNPNNPAALSN